MTRNGVPLIAKTVEGVAEELVNRVLGPRSEDVRPVLEWALGGDLTEIAARHGVSPAELESRLQQVRVMGGQTPLPPTVLVELSANNAHTEVHRRVRRLFGLRAPRGYLPMRMSRSTDVAVRVLATLGALPIEVLCAAANRSRQPTAALPAMTVTELEQGLRFRGATHNAETGAWAAPAGVAAVERDVQLVAAMRAAGPLTRVQLHQVLLEVGYTARTPQSPIVDRNPLIRRTAPNCYELLA